MENKINLNAAEIQSGQDRVRWAESLIKQLSDKNEGRNSWLLNYGTGKEAQKLRKIKRLNWDVVTKSCELAGSVGKVLILCLMLSSCGTKNVIVWTVGDIVGLSALVLLLICLIITCIYHWAAKLFEKLKSKTD